MKKGLFAIFIEPKPFQKRIKKSGFVKIEKGFEEI